MPLSAVTSTKGRATAAAAGPALEVGSATPDAGSEGGEQPLANALRRPIQRPVPGARIA